MYNKASSHEAFSKNNIRHTYTQKTHHLNLLKAVVKAVGGAFTHWSFHGEGCEWGQKRVSMSSVDEEKQQQRFIKQILHKDQKTAIATSVSISTAHKQQINHSRREHF